MRKLICILLAVVGGLCLGAFEAGDTASACAASACEEIAADNPAQAGLWCKRIYNSDFNLSRPASAPRCRVMERHDYRPSLQHFAQRMGLSCVENGWGERTGLPSCVANLFARTHSRGYYLHGLRRLII